MAVVIHPTAEVSTEADIGDGTYIWNEVQVREGAKIGANCRLGKCVYVDKNVVIGDDCKIQNRVSLYDGVSVGNRVFLGPHVAFVNDLYPRGTDEFDLVRTVVEDGASIGANATILGGLTIGKFALVAAGSVVTKDVPPHALVAGNPAVRIGTVCDCGHPADEKGGCDRCQKTLVLEGSK